MPGQLDQALQSRRGDAGGRMVAWTTTRSPRRPWGRAARAARALGSDRSISACDKPFSQLIAYVCLCLPNPSQFIRHGGPEHSIPPVVGRKKSPASFRWPGLSQSPTEGELPTVICGKTFTANSNCERINDRRNLASCLFYQTTLMECGSRLARTKHEGCILLCPEDRQSHAD